MILTRLNSNKYNNISRFKRDMSAIKKNLKTFKLIPQAEFDILQEKVDQIAKIVVPKARKKDK